MTLGVNFFILYFCKLIDGGYKDIIKISTKVIRPMEFVVYNLSFIIFRFFYQYSTF